MPPGGGIDAWVNPNMGDSENGDVRYLFPGLAERMARGTTVSQLIDEMDEAGVGKAVLCSGYSDENDREYVDEARNRFPDRFVASHLIDPRKGMASVRLVDELVSKDDYRLMRMMGLQTQLYYNDPTYYPVFTKCAELGIPVGLNVGIPGPQVPSKYQDPMTLDDVCAFLPELTIVMQHGGEPWTELCVKLMLKWPNLHYMSSAIAPKHLSKHIIDFVNTRGADRIMFASDYPLLSHERCMREAANLPWRDADRFHAFVAGNAQRLFFDR